MIGLLDVFEVLIIQGLAVCDTYNSDILTMGGADVRELFPHKFC